MINNTVSLEYHGSNRNSHGISIYYDEDEFLNVYSQTAFAQATKWNEFLFKLIAPDTYLSINGRVVDNNGDGIYNATVLLSGPQGSIYTLSSYAGFYYIYGVIPDGTYDLTAVKNGYNPQTVSIDVEAGELYEGYDFTLVGTGGQAFGITALVIKQSDCEYYYSTWGDENWFSDWQWWKDNCEGYDLNDYECGNSVLEPGEACEGSVTLPCTVVGFTSGQMSCDSCSLDTFGCVGSVSNVDYDGLSEAYGQLQTCQDELSIVEDDYEECLIELGEVDNESDEINSSLNEYETKIHSISGDSYEITTYIIGEESSDLTCNMTINNNSFQNMNVNESSTINVSVNDSILIQDIISNIRLTEEGKGLVTFNITKDTLTVSDSLFNYSSRDYQINSTSYNVTVDDIFFDSGNPTTRLKVILMINGELISLYEDESSYLQNLNVTITDITLEALEAGNNSINYTLKII